MVKVELSWTFEKTNDYPSYKCVADIKTITQDGTEFSRNMNIKGDSPDDCINLIFRNEHFTPLLKALTKAALPEDCLLYTSPSPRDRQKSRMPSSA